jgi:hypothetical protein
MALISSKEKLTQHLDTDKTLLILFGSEAQTVAVHNKAKQMKADNELAKRHVPLRVADLGLMTPTQKTTWDAAPGKYVVLRVNATAGRDIISKGLVTKFMTGSDEPGKTNIQLAFRGRL